MMYNKCVTNKTIGTQQIMIIQYLDILKTYNFNISHFNTTISV